MDVLEVRSFFFMAMSEGWAAAGDKKIVIADMPGYKALSFRDGDFYLLDRYCVNPNTLKSAGTTTIWFQGIPVWVMNYGGFYEEEEIAFLKRALLWTYQRCIFVGCRGLNGYVEGLESSLLYVNHFRGDFARFDGHEEIFRVKNGASLGFHEYEGMSMA